ncbi:MAG: hypothetical protein U1E26_00605 [Coriobacteriia bacterium]|nr:hypothetical protein [Coriobacteriia bacterium]
MAKKTSAKRAFDWRTYSKPARHLTDAQEEAFVSGRLAGILQWTHEDPRTRFEIRARQAGLYHRGVSLARIGGEGPFSVEIDGTDGTVADRHEVAGDQDVLRLIERLSSESARVDAAIGGGSETRHRRSFAAAIAAGNCGSDLASDGLIALDTDYALGRRKLDLAVVLRSEGVAGPGGFANPELAFIDVRVPGQTLTGQGGLAPLAEDFADYAKALSGEHVRRSCEELAALAAQKVRLGLLPGDLDLRSISEGLPHLVIAFAERDPSAQESTAPLVEIHERLSARHYPTTRLHFVHFTLVPESGDGLAVGEDDLMDYRAFKAYRATLG